VSLALILVIVGTVGLAVSFVFWRRNARRLREEWRHLKEGR
jgi:hypothetical protein